MVAQNSRVWFKHISLENARSFGPQQTLYFTEDGTANGRPAQWNVILGDNGVGKTTVLKALCLLGGENSNERVVSMLRSSDQSIRVEGMAQSEERLIPLVGNIHIQTHKLEGPRVYNSDLAANLISLGDTFLLFAYGASRKSGNVQTDSRRPTDSLFDENVILSSPESWLLEAELDSLKNTADAQPYEVVRKVLQRLFLGDIDNILSRKRFGVNKVIAITKFGEVPLEELSLGYRTLMAWVVDLARRLFSIFTQSPDPLSESAVCLVDEIDLHLHPRLQRTITSFLTETFPNTQFIVTAHSPLIVQAAENLNANLILLKREGDHTVAVNNPVDVRNWRLDQILTSELFGIESGRSERVQKLRTERDAILGKKTLSENDEEQVRALDREIGFVPFGGDQDEVKAETIIQQLADVLRSRVQNT